MRSDAGNSEVTAASHKRRSAEPPGLAAASGYLYLLPAAGLYLTFVLFPLLNGLWISFFSWDGVDPRRWVGLGNYKQLFTSSLVLHAFEHAAILAGFFCFFPIALALAIVAALARVPVRALHFLRAVLFLPAVVAPVVVGVSWISILDIEGPINGALRAVGLGLLARAWLGEYNWALPSIGVIGTWATFGLVMVLLISGMEQIPRSLFEAARVDGVGPVREFFAVTLPGLRNQLAIALTLTVIGALRTFDLVYVTTKGGPGNSTIVPSYLIYSDAFVTGQVGLAAATAIVLTAIILVLALLITKFVESGGDRRS